MSDDVSAHRRLTIAGGCLYAYCLLWTIGWLPQGRDGYVMIQGDYLAHVIWCLTHSLMLTGVSILSTWCIWGPGVHWRRIALFTGLISCLHVAFIFSHSHFVWYWGLGVANTVLGLTVTLTWLRVIHGLHLTRNVNASKGDATLLQLHLRTMLVLVTLVGIGMALARQVNWTFLTRLTTLLPIIWVGGLLTSFLPGFVVCMGSWTWRRMLMLLGYWILLPVVWSYGLYWVLRSQLGEEIILGDLVVAEIIAQISVAAVGALLCSWVLRSNGFRFAKDDWKWPRRRLTVGAFVH